MTLYEIFCGFTSSLIISPVMTLIDISIIKSQMQNQAFSSSLNDTIKDSINKKINIRKPFLTMFGVYSGTYCVANLTDYYCEKNNCNSNLHLITTSSCNIMLIIYKDKQYSKIFNKNYHNFPKISYGLFAIRDSLTIFFTFNYKKKSIKYLKNYMPHNIADFLSSICLPLFAQIISTPIHILAIDLYTNPSTTVKEKIINIKNQYKTVCYGRMLRVIPAFGLGGFINDMLRNRSNHQ